MKPRAKPTFPPGVTAAIDYCHAVLSGGVAACRLVHLTCERFLTDLHQAQLERGLWEFRPELAERAMTFAGLMSNIKGPETGHPLRLMPWQRLVFANLFGFIERSTGARRYRQAVVFVPRGNGKTSCAAPIALYLKELADACHGDQRPECPILRDLEARPGIGRAPGLPT